jgi:hypothetical protein
MQDSFQFSIRSLLLVTALVAASVAPFLWSPSLASYSARIALAIFLASLAIVASVPVSGINHAFWIGISLPMTISALVAGTFTVNMMMWSPVSLSEFFRTFDSPAVSNPWRSAPFLRMLNVLPAFWCFAPINGILCALGYRLFQSPPPASARRLSIRLSTLLWLTLAVGCWFGGVSFGRRAALDDSATPAAFRSAEESDDDDEEEAVEVYDDDGKDDTDDMEGAGDVTD